MKENIEGESVGVGTEADGVQGRFEKFTSLILAINRSVQRIKSEEMAKYSLNGVHVNCIFYLSASENGLSQGELAKLCREDKAYMSRALAELKKLGMTEHADGDKKYKSAITLTEKGKRIAEGTLAAVDRAVAAGSAGLTDADREVLYRCLCTVSKNLEKYNVEVITE